MVTSRVKKIIRIFLKSEDYITIATIAEKIEVSSRTVLRELDDVETWFNMYESSLDKKKGTGIKLLIGKISREMMLAILVDSKSDIIYTQEDRKVVIRAQLLQSNEPIKLYSLAHSIHMTESTVSNDLMGLESWFNNYHLEVSKKPGMGIFIKGDEKAKRQAIVALIYEHFHMTELIHYISKRQVTSTDLLSIESKVNNSILEMMELKSIVKIRELLVAVETEMGYQFADNGYIALAIRIGVTLKRFKMSNDIHIEEHLINGFYKDRIYLFIHKYLEEHPEHPLSVLSYEELVFLTMHIHGTKVRDRSNYNKVSMIEDFKIIQLVKYFIEATEAETGMYLSDNEDLTIGLVKHLRPALYRMKMNLDIINPLVEEIRGTYPKLFKAVKKSIKVIEDKEHIVVPDDEIAYLATHIGALIHKQTASISSRYRVVVACMYGIGASSFLVAQLKKQFSNLKIIEVISVMDDQLESLDKKGADFLITTVPVANISIPYVEIEAILKEEDIRKIKEIMAKIIPTRSIEKLVGQTKLKDKLQSLNEYSKVIIQLLDNYHSFDPLDFRSMNDVIEYISDYLSINKEEYTKLIYAFKLREEKGSTILRKKQMLLLHCRADIDKHVALQILPLQKTLFIQKDERTIPIKNIVVMVAPVELNQKVLEVLSEVSRNIIAEGYSDILIGSNYELMESELNNILEKFYQGLVLNFE